MNTCCNESCQGAHVSLPRYGSCLHRSCCAAKSWALSHFHLLPSCVEHHQLQWKGYGSPDLPETKAAAAAAGVAAKEPAPALAPPTAPAPTTTQSARRISGRHSTWSVRAPGRVGPASRQSDDGGVAVGCFNGAKVRKDRVLLVEPATVVAEPDPMAFDRRFGHRILVSTAGGCEGETAPAAQQRWSDLRPSDLMFVCAEFLVTEAGHYSCFAAVVNSGGNARSATGVRSLSELAVGVRRLPPIRAGVCEGEPRASGGGARRWPGSSWWVPRGSGAPFPARNGPIA